MGAAKSDGSVVLIITPKVWLEVIVKTSLKFFISFPSQPSMAVFSARVVKNRDEIKKNLLKDRPFQELIHFVDKTNQFITILLCES